ncbi:hypothetical protein [Pontiella sp.]|uniref:hypothetical protein n=1 Tax=Pontiella sp. TaxID=2837462 RepID=UPI003564D0B8
MDQSRFSTSPPAPGTSGAPAGAVRSSFAQRAIRAVQSRSSRCVSAVLYRIARDFVGGESLDDALKVAQRMDGNELNSTLGFWDAPSYTVNDIAAIYYRAVEGSASSGLDTYISIKPPALHFDLKRARELAHFAMENRVRLHCDSHGADVAEDTFDFIKAMMEVMDPELIGVTIPCRWQRSVSDTEFAIEHQLNVRLVKGEWPDSPGQDRDLQVGFMETVEQLSGRARHVAVASHDIDLALAAVKQLSESGTSCELELLHGFPMTELIHSARELNMRPRIYVPFGRGYMPHALRVFKTNPHLALWLGKDRLSRLFGKPSA